MLVGEAELAVRIQVRHLGPDRRGTFASQPGIPGKLAAELSLHRGIVQMSKPIVAFAELAIFEQRIAPSADKSHFRFFVSGSVRPNLPPAGGPQVRRRWVMPCTVPDIFSRPNASLSSDVA